MSPAPVDARQVLPPPGARCSAHPQTPATGVCARCGAFVCGDDARTLDGLDYCAPCVARPDVDYLEALRRQLWGRRSGWAWFYGLSGLFWLLQSGYLVTVWLGDDERSTASITLLQALMAFAHGAAGVFFWLGKPGARVGLAAVTVLAGVLLFREWALRLAWFTSLLAVAAASSDVRTKLFFRIDVSRQALQRLWDRRHNNPEGRQAPLIGLAGLLIPLFSPLAIVAGIVGLARANPHARPPVGYRGRAALGVVLGVLGILWWVRLLTLQ